MESNNSGGRGASILKFLYDYQKSTGFHCGLTTVKLSQKMNMPLNELKPILRKLYGEKRIRLRDNVHGKLLWLTDEEIEKFKNQ